MIYAKAVLFLIPFNFFKKIRSILNCICLKLYFELILAVIKNSMLIKIQVAFDPVFLTKSVEIWTFNWNE